jgi:TRAP-type C4-dicarboxylate transport system permease small subunit
VPETGPRLVRAAAALSRGLDRLYRLCGALAAICLVAMTGMILTSIVARIAGVFIAGITEMAGYTMAASAFFAMSYTFRSGGHIRVELLLSGLPARRRRVAEIWCLAVMAGVSGYLAFHLGELVYDSWRFGEVSEGADALPLWMVQTPMALGAVVFALSAAHALVQGLFDPDAAGPDGRVITRVEVEAGRATDLGSRGAAPGAAAGDRSGGRR